MSVKKEAVEAAAKALDGLQPETETLSAKQAVIRLKAKLVNARSRGIGYDRLAAALGEAGVTISAGALRRYMADFSDRKRSRKGEGAGGSGDPKAKAAPTKTRAEKGAGAPPAVPAQSSGDCKTPASWSFPVRPDRKDI